MGHPKIGALALALGLLLASGCASLRHGVQGSLRKAGEKAAGLPEEVAEEYDCARQRLPFFTIETHEILPPRIDPGEVLDQRLVYALCPVRPTETVRGTLTERILYRGAALLSESYPYELKPGRWIVDREVEVPPQAEPGVYAFELEFRGPGVDFARSLSFVVEAPAAGAAGE